MVYIHIVLQPILFLQYLWFLLIGFPDRKSERKLVLSQDGKDVDFAQ